MSTKKYHIEPNSVQETLIIPLYGRKVCAEHYPQLFDDPEAERLCASLDYDFSVKGKKMEKGAGLFGALEVGQRHYDLLWEIGDYLKEHPKAAVVNMGCGLDDSFEKVNNGLCHGYNIDMPDVIKIRNELLPPAVNEENIGCDLNDFSWMDRIDASDGVIFFAAGVFYYFKKEDVQILFTAMAKRFPHGVLAFDCCNARGAKMMTKTWLKEAGITDVGAFFSLQDGKEIMAWSHDIRCVTERSYMRGYRDIYHDVSLLFKLLIQMCDKIVRMNIVRVEFR